jgi:hypothetical protein
MLSGRHCRPSGKLAHTRRNPPSSSSSTRISQVHHFPLQNRVTRLIPTVRTAGTGEGDLLGRSLWKMSGGQVKFKDFQVKGLRNLGVDESKVVAEFSAYWDQTGQRMKPKKVPANFYMYMKSSSTAS